MLQTAELAHVDKKEPPSVTLNVEQKARLGVIVLLSFSSYFVKLVIKNIFPELRTTQRENLSLGVFGQIKAQSGVMSEIVREIPGAKKHKHRLKRFWRFL